MCSTVVLVPTFLLLRHSVVVQYLLKAASLLIAQSQSHCQVVDSFDLIRVVLLRFSSALVPRGVVDCFDPLTFPILAVCLYASFLNL